MTVRATGVPPGGRRPEDAHCPRGCVFGGVRHGEGRRGQKGEATSRGAAAAGRRRPAEAAAAEQVGAEDEEAAFNWGFGRERRAKTRRDRKAREPFR